MISKNTLKNISYIFKFGFYLGQLPFHFNNLPNPLFQLTKSPVKWRISSILNIIVILLEMILLLLSLVTYTNFDVVSVVFFVFSFAFNLFTLTWQLIYQFRCIDIFKCVSNFIKLDWTYSKFTLISYSYRYQCKSFLFFCCYFRSIPQSSG